MRGFNIKRKVKWKGERDRKRRGVLASSEEQGKKVIANVTMLEKIKYTC